MANIQQNLNKAKDEVKAAAGEVKRDAQNTAGDYVDRAKDAASNVADKAREMASSAMDRAKDAASNLGKKAESGLEAVGSGLTSAAGTIRENLPSEGMLHNVPEERFGRSFDNSFVETFNFIIQADRAEFRCANGIHPLLGNTPVTWSSDDCQAFLSALRTLWNKA